MAPLKTYSYEKAGELLRSDAPLSVRTIERMVANGELERIGGRFRRSISERSIIAYQEGRPGEWHGNGNQQTAGGSRAQAMPPARRTGHGSGTSRSRHEDIMSDEASIPARLPRRGVIPFLNGNPRKKM